MRSFLDNPSPQSAHGAAGSEYTIIIAHNAKTFAKGAKFVAGCHTLVKIINHRFRPYIHIGARMLEASEHPFVIGRESVGEIVGERICASAPPWPDGTPSYRRQTSDRSAAQAPKDVAAPPGAARSRQAVSVHRLCLGCCGALSPRHISQGLPANEMCRQR